MVRSSRIVALDHSRHRQETEGDILTATHGGPKRPRYALGLCASMLLVPISCVASIGGDSDAAAFDLTYAPTAEKPADLRMSRIGEAALRAISDVSPTTPAAARGLTSVSGSVSAGTALAKTTAVLEPQPEPETTTPTTVLVDASSEANTVAEPSPPPASPPISLNLPLDLGSALQSLTDQADQGEASWFDAPAGTCAHQTLPFGTLVTVTNLYDGTSTTCEVDDRGPFIDGRVIDLSRDVFEELAHPGSGVIDVVIEW